MFVYSMLLVFAFLALLFQIFSAERYIPTCSIDGVWIPLARVSTNLSDPSILSTYFCLAKAPQGKPFNWYEASTACNGYKGFLLYTFGYPHLESILRGYKRELNSTRVNIATAPLAKRTIFLSLHDYNGETEYQTDMRFLYGRNASFSSNINRTDGLIEQLATRGLFTQGYSSIWNPRNGVVNPRLIGSETNTEESDCLATVIAEDETYQQKWISCTETRATQAICVREGNSSLNSEPCFLRYSYQQLTTNTAALGAAIIDGNQPIRLLYVESIDDARRNWLKSDDDVKSFLLPRRNDIYFLVLCADGWFISAETFPVVTLSCYDIDRQLGLSTAYSRLLCPYYDGCVTSDGSKALYKGTHIQRCSSHGYCVSSKVNSTYGSTSCICQYGFSGDMCEKISYDPCNDTLIPDRCGKGQKCVGQQYDYYCECVGKLSYNKYSCDAEIDECANKPCKNNATCVDGLNSFYCECQKLMNGTKQIFYENGTEAYWTGKLCDLDPINSCFPENPCEGFPNTEYLKLYDALPGGTCQDTLDGFRCACDYPWSGERCHEYDKNNIVQAVTGSKRILIYIYLVIFIIFNFACMLLTMLRRREITQGRYHTDDMIISVYESQKKEERDKLMQFVEEAAYSSDDDDSIKSKAKKSASRRDTDPIGLAARPADSQMSAATRSRISVPTAASPSGVMLQSEQHTTYGIPISSSVSYTGSGKRSSKKRRSRSRSRR